MPQIRFIHTADFHLSRPFGFLPPKQADERRKDQRDTFSRMIDLAIRKSSNIAIFAGDIFDRAEPDPTDVEAVIQGLKRLSEAGILSFIIPGNHDHIHTNSIWHKIHADRLHIFTGTNWAMADVPELGLSVYGTAFDRQNSDRRAFDGLTVDPHRRSIVIAHASYESFGAALEKYHPFSYEEIANLKASYVALGHYHKYSQIEAGSINACYSGSPEGISFDASELGDRYVVFGEIEDDGKVSIEPIKINNKTMKYVELDCTSYLTEASLVDAVRSICEEKALIEIHIKGTVSPELAPIISDLPERFKEKCQYITIDTSDLSIYSEVSESDNTIKAQYFRYMLQQINQAENPERAKVLKKALELGLSALDGKRV